MLESQETLEGLVAGYNKGGLIVKLGHLRGFIPASQVSLSRRRRAEGETPDKRWGKMVGEPIVAKVIEVDRRRNRLILSERAAAREARKVLKEHLITELQAGEIRMTARVQVMKNPVHTGKQMIGRQKSASLDSYIHCSENLSLTMDVRI